RAREPSEAVHQVYGELDVPADRVGPDGRRRLVVRAIAGQRPDRRHGDRQDEPAGAGRGGARTHFFFRAFSIFPLLTLSDSSCFTALVSAGSSETSVRSASIASSLSPCPRYAPPRSPNASPVCGSSVVLSL